MRDLGHTAGIRWSGRRCATADCDRHTPRSLRSYGGRRWDNRRYGSAVRRRLQERQAADEQNRRSSQDRQAWVSARSAHRAFIPQELTRLYNRRNTEWRFCMAISHRVNALERLLSYDKMCILWKIWIFLYVKLKQKATHFSAYVVLHEWSEIVEIYMRRKEKAKKKKTRKFVSKVILRKCV